MIYAPAIPMSPRRGGAAGLAAVRILDGIAAEGCPLCGAAAPSRLRHRATRGGQEMVRVTCGACGRTRAVVYAAGAR